MEYSRADIEIINRAIEHYDWESLFLGKNVHQQVEIFIKRLLNILHNYIRNKFNLSNDKVPLWIDEKIKSFNHEKNGLYHNQRKSVDYTSGRLYIFRYSYSRYNKCY